MLYFSRIKKDPSEIDLDQLAKLRDFEKKTFPNALVETYSTQIEFRDKLSRQLEIQVRVLLAKETGEAQGQTTDTSVTDIQFHFADAKTGADAGTEITLETSYIILEDAEKIPDYADPEENKPSKAKTEPFFGFSVYSAVNAVNKDYYREKAGYLIEQSFFRPLRFWLKNTGSVGARDIYIDIKIVAEKDELIVAETDQFRSSTPSKHTGTILTGGSSQGIGLENQGAQWEAHLQMPALQPQREVSPSPHLVIGAKKNCKVIVEAQIYADTLPKPIRQTLTANLRVRQITVRAQDLLGDEVKKSHPGSH